MRQRLSRPTLMLLCYLLFPLPVIGFMSDSNVAGYEPFSRLDEVDGNSSIIGLIWTVDNVIYTSRCIESYLYCEDGKTLYQHNKTISDIDVYFDEDGIYFCDITGHVFWYDLLLPTSDPEYLPADLLVNELSVDWLSNKLYITSFYSQIYKCDSRLRSCLSLNIAPLGYQPSSLVADPYNGYLYWKNEAQFLVKHDLSLSHTDIARSDVIITSHVLTYSVSFNHYDLYSIHYYNDTYSEIALTYLNGQNQRTHIPLTHSNLGGYSELNCFHNEFCLWLDTIDDNRTHLCWHRQQYNQWSNITNLNVTKHSIMKQWHRGVQPIPIPETPPEFSNIYADSNSIVVNWRKPDILAYLIRIGKLINIWNPGQILQEKYMQSEAAWANWTYELSVTHVESNNTQVITDIKDTSYLIDDLLPKSYYDLSLLAYNDIKKGKANSTRISTITDDPVLYVSHGKTITALDTLGNSLNIWSTTAWNICSMDAGEDNYLYTVSVPDNGACDVKKLRQLVIFRLGHTGEDNNITKVYQRADVSSASYDWIGMSVYVFTTRPERILARIILDTLTKSDVLTIEPITTENTAGIDHMKVEPISSHIYISDNTILRRCQTGPLGVCEATMEILQTRSTVLTSLSGVLIDTISNSVYVAQLANNGLSLQNLQSSLSTTTIKSLSSPEMVAADDNLYLFIDGMLHAVDLNTERLVNFTNIIGTAIAYKSPRSYPLLPGMNSTEDIIPQISDESVAITGAYDNLTLTWALTFPVVTEVQYNVTVFHETDGQILIQQIVNDSAIDLGGKLEPETLLRIFIQPYTHWRNGDVVDITRITPSAIPSIVSDISMFLRQGGMTPQLVVRWTTPEFTGGTITEYYINITSENAEHYQEVVNDTTVILPVSLKAVFNISVRAETSAGPGDWSPIVQHDTGIPSALPPVRAHPYTPETVQVLWDLAKSVATSGLYNYTLVYHRGDNQAIGEVANIKVVNQFYTISGLEHHTQYSIEMRVCSTSNNRTLWFAGQQCEMSNSVTVTTFIEPRGLTVLRRTDSTIQLQWLSPPANGKIISHYITYAQVGYPLDKREKELDTTEPQFTYTYTLDKLKADTEYTVKLILNYEKYNGYSEPAFIVKTLQSVPGAISITSAECNKDDCFVTIEGGLSSITHIWIKCENMRVVNITMSPGDSRKVIPRNQLSDDITSCSVLAQSQNNAGQGPMSAAAQFGMKTSGSTDPILAVALSITATLVILFVVVFAISWRRCRKSKSSNTQNGGAVSQMNLMEMTSPTYNNSLMSSTSPTFQFTLTENTAYASEDLTQFRQSVGEDKYTLLPLFDRHNLMLTRFLGSGAFGEVYEGKAHNIITPDTISLVAVKTLRSEASDSDKEEFVKEAKLMSQFDSEFIVKLLGVCIDKDPYYLLLELMNQGDLVGFLRKSRPTRERSGALSLSELLSVCVDVAAGCKYLELLHFVHRDLAARNCLVSLGQDETRYRVKLGDFGLARDIYRNDYYRKEGEALLPVRWMSPEALVDGVFTTQSDIWAFGVLIWEVFALAMQPYPARSNIEVLQFVTGSGTLERPVRCPIQIYEIMKQCWSYASSDRPSFLVIHKNLTDLQTQLQTSAVLDWFSKVNKRLASENEFFAGSTSSAHGVEMMSDVPESPVFDPKSMPETPESGDTSADRFSFSAAESHRSASRTKSFMDFFKRKITKDNHHNILSRVHSTPAEVSKRPKNKYVRSDSTISADRLKSSALRTYFPDDGEESFTPAELHSYKHGLQVDVTDHLASQSSRPPILYTTLGYNKDSNLEHIEESSSPTASISLELPADNRETKSDDKSPARLGRSSEDVSASMEPQRTDSDTVQYSSMNFAGTPSSETDTEQQNGSPGSPKTAASVQYSSMNFAGTKIGKADTEQQDASAGSSPTEPSVQYSTIAFPANQDKPEGCTSFHEISERNNSSEGDPPKNEPTVQYSTMSFPTTDRDNNEGSDNLTNDSPAAEPPEEETVQYSTINFNGKETISPPITPDEHLNTTPGSDAACVTAGVVPEQNTQSSDGVGLSLDVTRDTTPSSAPNTPPPPPINIAVIKSTPQGTKVEYNAHQFKHSPANQRRAIYGGRNTPPPKSTDNNNQVQYSTMSFPSGSQDSNC